MGRTQSLSNGFNWPRLAVRHRRRLHAGNVEGADALSVYLPVQPCDTYVMATRNKIDRLLDGMPDDRVAAIGEILPAAWEQA